MTTRLDWDSPIKQIGSTRGEGRIFAMCWWISGGPTLEGSKSVVKAVPINIK